MRITYTYRTYKGIFNGSPNSVVTMETKGEKSRAAYFSEGELEVLMLAYEEFKPIIMKKATQLHMQRKDNWLGKK